ncbi:3-oxoadipate enol-lactonase [Crenobacter cavernae]|uniref:3-oxoadipate enol-lactonase n=1 Tax=Crenobacter cavernae TaxID=2290923 RepID=A0ABY0FJG9_9NEIS|nr:3-oxoadipate enol-lactonase [Crenobacter cavernae]RXZ45553.1 3-oxoadipate enol-lactonase [Crenobacter cavernae]
MPFIDLDTGRLHYQFDGFSDAPVLLLSNSLGTDINMWSPQLDAFTRHFRVLRYDTRGHGHSVNTPGPYSLELLGRDVITLLDALGIERAYFCGISMGGLTGQWLAVNAPDRLIKLVVSNTAARIGDAAGWQARAHLVRESGIPEVADGAASRWFTPHFIQHKPELVEMLLHQLRNSHAAGYAACCDALAVADLSDDIARIPLPTLVVAGTFDAVTTPADADFIAGRIEGARRVDLPASHLSNVEAAADFNREVLDFLLQG